MQSLVSSRSLAGSAAALALALGCGTTTQAASHREAPLIAQDPAADITDVYAFRSWGNPDECRVHHERDPRSGAELGPNYFFFDPKVAYDFNLDVNQDGVAEDIIYRVRFSTQIRPPFNDLPVAYAGVDGVPGLPPGIRDLRGERAAGLGLRQTYTVTEIKGSSRRTIGRGTAVPSNIGPRTMPDYEGLAAQGIRPLANGGQVFAGQRDETFYIDLGATFDTLNFRRTPILSTAEDQNDGVNPFGVDMFSGFNVNTIALEIPIAEIVKGSKSVIGMYASTSRPRVLQILGNGTSVGTGGFVQVARMGNPLINELVIGTGRKDNWNATDPAKEARFLDFYLNPRLAAVINLAFGIPIPTPPRTDLVAALLKYPGQDPTDLHAPRTPAPSCCAWT